MKLLRAVSWARVRVCSFHRRIHNLISKSKDNRLPSKGPHVVWRTPAGSTAEVLPRKTVTSAQAYRRKVGGAMHDTLFVRGVGHWANNPHVADMQDDAVLRSFSL